MLTRKIPATNEELPVVGLGTWKTFDKEDFDRMEPLVGVLHAMRSAGAKCIDSSPMYGKSEKVIGALTMDPVLKDYFFYATKVWTTGKQEGINQMNASFRKMRRNIMDLMQIHNLVDWKTQLQTLKAWKAEGKIRYIGITHYTDNMHDELQRVLKAGSIDFVQFNYSIFARNAEKSLLQASADHGVATLVNRPFGTGNDFNKVNKITIPGWAKERGIKNWSQFFLSFIISHPLVTTVIPATGNPFHAAENFDLPDDIMFDELFRNKMTRFIETL